MDARLYAWDAANTMAIEAARCADNPEDRAESYVSTFDRVFDHLLGKLQKLDGPVTKKSK